MNQSQHPSCQVVPHRLLQWATMGMPSPGLVVSANATANPVNTLTISNIVSIGYTDTGGSCVCVYIISLLSFIIDIIYGFMQIACLESRV